MTERIMICGATGKPCNCKPNENGQYPCQECEIGKEFLKNWDSSIVLHDE